MENKYLFVCYANINRSIVGERIFKKMLLERGFRVGGFQDSGEFDFYVGSAGINPEDKSKEFSLSMVEGVRNVFVADEHIRRLLKSDYKYEDESRLVNLDFRIFMILVMIKREEFWKVLCGVGCFIICQEESIFHKFLNPNY